MTSEPTPSPTSTRRGPSPRGQRTLARTVHLLAAVALGAFVYAPADLVEPVRLVLQLVAVPAATLTGIFLWKQAAVRRWVARLRS